MHICHEIKATLKLIGQPTKSFSHVKGPQHNGQSVESLDLPAQLNVEADHAADELCSDYPAHRLWDTIQPNSTLVDALSMASTKKKFDSPSPRVRSDHTSS
jgi:hypothetical protein